MIPKTGRVSPAGFLSITRKKAPANRQGPFLLDYSILLRITARSERTDHPGAPDARNEP